MPVVTPGALEAAPGMGAARGSAAGAGANRFGGGGGNPKGAGAGGGGGGGTGSAAAGAADNTIDAATPAVLNMATTVRRIAIPPIARGPVWHSPVTTLIARQR
ncbi:hypothetical protein MMUR_12310 [Mycolicibacterium murale]|uniref:Uncharacterized protein n=1 Tax=Mycolicibacterium murale TaxID=182220 RepID=A0A7I9WH55_9MYCO|nr:hypothetical protein MMUR_12310 [Mycolicibacterium murale]